MLGSQLDRENGANVVYPTKLLSTHENGQGPVDWKDKSQRNRLGLDLRGADLRHLDLHHLPLACLYGGTNRGT
jgi:hypothetical protein